MYFTCEYIKDVLEYELKIRGYEKIKFKVKNNTLEEMQGILMSVLRQLELEKIKRGDKM